MSLRDRIIVFLERFVVNPVVRSLLRWGIAPRAFALLETVGRRSGLPRLTPVGNGLQGRTFWLIVMRGGHCAYLSNLVADPHVKVKMGKVWHSGTATVVGAPDPEDALAKRRELDVMNGVVGRLDGVIFRHAARDPLTVRIDLE